MALFSSSLADGTLSGNGEDNPLNLFHYSPDGVLKGGALFVDSFLTPDGTLTSQQAINQLALDFRNGTPLFVHTFSVSFGQVRPADTGFISGNIVGPANGRVGFWHSVSK